MKLLCFIVCLVLASFLQVKVMGDNSYENIKSLKDSKLSASRYSRALRPVRNQSDIVTVEFSFSLVAIVSLNDVTQELVTNGFLALHWKDELISWNQTDYGGVKTLEPEPKQIWRPRLLIINTLDKRDAFGDDYSHVYVHAHGGVSWFPGGLFHTYCRLNMVKFPFDVQRCHIQLCPMNYVSKSVRFTPDDDMNMGFFFPNHGWDLLETEVKVINVQVLSENAFSCPTFYFTLKRRSQTILLNVILPIVLMSLLNNLVFIVPVESGEKISYAVTVLLSLTVFLSMVSTMTPQVTDTVPALTIYLFVLLVTSVLTVVAAIFTVFLHHRDEKACLESKKKLQHDDGKLMKTKAGISSKVSFVTTNTIQEVWSKEEDVPEVNKYRMVSRHINKIFFVIVTLKWMIMTTWFFAVTNS